MIISFLNLSIKTLNDTYFKTEGVVFNKELC